MGTQGMMGTWGMMGTLGKEAELGLGAPSPPQVTALCPGLGTGVRGRGGGDANNSSGPAGMFQPGAAGEGGGERQGVLHPPLPRVSPTAEPRAPPPVGAAFLPPRAAAAPGRISPPAPPRAAPSRPRRAAEGGIGGGRGVGAERKIKKGGRKDKHTPPKKPSLAVAGSPLPPVKAGQPRSVAQSARSPRSVSGCTRGAVQRHTWTIQTIHTRTYTRRYTRGEPFTRPRGNAAAGEARGGGSRPHLRSR